MRLTCLESKTTPKNRHKRNSVRQRTLQRQNNAIDSDEESLPTHSAVQYSQQRCSVFSPWPYLPAKQLWGVWLKPWPTGGASSLPVRPYTRQTCVGQLWKILGEPVVDIFPEPLAVLPCEKVVRHFSEQTQVVFLVSRGNKFSGIISEVSGLILVRASTNQIVRFKSADPNHWHCLLMHILHHTSPILSRRMCMSKYAPWYNV